ncbi:hypothetical protein HELRODRAFT_168032 [Helobdella robusta]|uniref:Integrin alpha-2 domain-containing protein n=1 Tax=Helobdella robusta TaxID=6412 RepID=T1F031_HELRO|nr:hypothetical protein HELRODRAFT_168032 [Helobdella robusta]ESO10163.1 hypothetical protein HELRODRAFT_168032 [Helobdella robusta]
MNTLSNVHMLGKNSYFRNTPFVKLFQSTKYVNISDMVVYPKSYSFDVLLLVGAPSCGMNKKLSLMEGCVQECSVDENICKTTKFERVGSTKEWNGQTMMPVENKTHQMLGASLSASANGLIVACAPRYVFMSRSGLLREPIGTCYLKNISSNKFYKLQPCKKGLLGHHKQGHCQAGFSAHLSQLFDYFIKDGKNLALGAVGSYFWQGEAFLYNFENDVDPILPLETSKSSYDKDYIYTGYSVSMSYYDEDDLIGSVNIF